MLIGCAAYTLFHSNLEPASGTRSIINRVQDVIPFSQGDRELTDEINRLATMIDSGEIVSTLIKNNYLE